MNIVRKPVPPSCCTGRGPLHFIAAWRQNQQITRHGRQPERCTLIYSRWDYCLLPRSNSARLPTGVCPSPFQKRIDVPFHPLALFRWQALDLRDQRAFCVHIHGPTGTVVGPACRTRRRTIRDHKPRHSGRRARTAPIRAPTAVSGYRGSAVPFCAGSGATDKSPHSAGSAVLEAKRPNTPGVRPSTLRGGHRQSAKQLLKSTHVATRERYTSGGSSRNCS